MGLLDNDPNLIADIEKHGHFGYAQRVRKLAEIADAGLSAAVDSQIELQSRVIELQDTVRHLKAEIQVERSSTHTFKSRLLKIREHAHIEEEV